MEADAGEDWRIDPILRERCQPVVNLACKDVSLYMKIDYKHILVYI